MGRKPMYTVCYTLDGERRMTCSLSMDKRAIAETLGKIFPGHRIEVVWLQWCDKLSGQQAQVWCNGGSLP